MSCLFACGADHRERAFVALHAFRGGERLLFYPSCQSTSSSYSVAGPYGLLHFKSYSVALESVEQCKRFSCHRITARQCSTWNKSVTNTDLRVLFISFFLRSIGTLVLKCLSWFMSHYTTCSSHFFYFFIFFFMNSAFYFFLLLYWVDGDGEWWQDVWPDHRSLRCLMISDY